MAEVTSESLRVELLTLVPERCKIGESICPRILGMIDITTIGFDHYSEEERKAVAESVIDTMKTFDTNCRLGLKEAPRVPEGVVCRIGHLCSGFGSDDETDWTDLFKTATD